MTAAEQIRNEGRIEARIETARRHIEKLIAARGMTLSDVGRARLAACADPSQLERWYDRALTAEAE